MRSRTLAILTALVAVLLAFIFLFEKDLPSTDERTLEEKKVITAEADDVRALQISWGDQQVRFEHQGEPAEWRLVEPFEARADAAAVDGLLAALTGLEKKRTLEGADPAGVGLDEPRARVTIATGDGETVLELGAEVPASNDVIVGVAGRSEAYQVSPGNLWDDLTREPGDWRDKRLLTAGRSTIERLTLEEDGTRLLLVRRGDDFWIESPIADLADRGLVDGLLAEVTGLETESFLDDPVALPAELGLEPPARVLEVVLEGRDQPFRLELGDPVDDGAAFADVEPTDAASTVYARADGQLVTVETKLASAFERPPGEWRSRAWTTTQVFRVDGARFEDGDGTVEVRRDDGDWLRGDERVDYAAVSDVLYAVADAEADEVTSRADAEARGHRLDEPRLTIVLTTEDGDETLRLYPVHEGRAAALREGREAVLLVPEEAVGELFTKLDALRSAEPLPEEGEEASAEDGGD